VTKPAGYLTNSLTGLEGERGVFYDYIMAGNGLFLQARNKHLAATVCIAPAEVRGLTPIQENVELLHGKIPRYLLELAISMLCADSHIEQYLAIIWEGEYHLKKPDQTATVASVTYDVLPDTVLDIHSHVEGVGPHFSYIDDHDEQGFCLSAVVGDLANLFPTVELRCGIYGYFLPMSREEIFI